MVLKSHGLDGMGHGPGSSRVMVLIGHGLDESFDNSSTTAAF